MELVWKKFSALGTEIILTAYLEPQDRYLLDKAQAQIFEFEQRFSRFVPTSELNALNDFAGGEYRASDRLVDLLQRCQYYYKETQGLFNPEILDILEAVGYDRPFDRLAANQVTHEIALAKRVAGQKAFSQRPKFDDLKIKGNLLTVPKGMRLDFGGIGKGYIVDLLAREVFSAIENYWLSAGGDLLAKGNDGQKSGWQIAVQNPLFAEKDSFSFNTLGQTLGIATSGIVKRQGIVGGLEWHHLIDPRTLEPAKNEVASVTIIGPTAEQADVYAKTVLLLGGEAGLELIEQHAELEGAIYFLDKSPLFSRGLIKYL